MILFCRFLEFCWGGDVWDMSVNVWLRGWGGDVWDMSVNVWLRVLKADSFFHKS